MDLGSSGQRKRSRRAPNVSHSIGQRERSAALSPTSTSGYGREGPSEREAYRALAMAGNDANPGGGPSRIGTLHEQTPLWAVTRGVVAEGSR